MKPPKACPWHIYFIFALASLFTCLANSWTFAPPPPSPRSRRAGMKPRCVQYAGGSSFAIIMISKAWGVCPCAACPARACGRLGYCPCRKSNSRVLVVQAAENRSRLDASY